MMTYVDVRIFAINVFDKVCWKLLCGLYKVSDPFGELFGPCFILTVWHSMTLVYIEIYVIPDVISTMSK